MMIEKFQTLLRYSIWGCLLILPAELNIIQIMFWLLVFNFFLEKEKWDLLWQNKVFILLLVQYPLIVSLRIFLTHERDYEIITYPAEYQMWIYCIIGVLVGTVFFGKTRNLKEAKIFLTGSLFITFVVAAYQFHILDDPKVKLFNANVFQAPLFATMIGIILFSIIKQDRGWIIPKTIFIFAPLLMFSIAYAGTRGIFIGQIATLTLGIFVFFFLKKYHVAMGLLASLFLGVAFAIFIDAEAGGSFARRLDVIILLAQNNALNLALAVFAVGALILMTKYALQKINFRSRTCVVLLMASLLVASAWAYENGSDLGATDRLTTFQNQLSKNIALAETSDGSTSARLQFLKKGISELEGHLLTGRGVYMEPYIAREVLGGHKHLHNNYVSWLIWGGIFVLVSGLIWLISPVILTSQQVGLNITVFPMMIASLWSVSLLFDSFFAWNGFTYAYTILICLAYQAFRSKNHENVQQIGTIG
jgi:hypothetical protein